MPTKQTFIGAVPTPTTGSDVANNGAHSPATLDQNFANLRKTADDAAAALGGFTASQTAGVNEIPVVASDKSLSLPGGVKFPATQVASADPNTLDDYEEGTWTPVVRDAFAGNAATSATVTGKYTKFGRMVLYQMSVVNINTTGLTAGNVVYITGLPFLASNNVNLMFPASVWTSKISSTTGNIMGHAQQNSSSLTFQNGTTSGDNTQLLVSQLVSTAADFYISGSYETA